MTDPTHQLLLGHLLGALEDEEHDRVDALVEQDDQWRQTLVDWRRRLAPLEAMRPDFEPPPGLAERTCRFVAAHLPALDAASGARRRMTPCPVPPSRVAGLGWLDAAAVLLFVAVAVMLVFPAIDGSRFKARLASCQDGLRQFGLALAQYGGQHQSAMTQLADGGRLTPAGLMAVGRLMREKCLDESDRPLCSDAWLSAQGIAASWKKSLSSENLPNNRTNCAGCAISLDGMQPAALTSTNWSGTWRDGMTNGRQLSDLPTATPLLADAPSADLPGQVSSSHGGLGRNVLFKDGHAEFLPSSLAGGSATGTLLQGLGSFSTGISTPVVWVSGRND